MKYKEISKKNKPDLVKMLAEKKTALRDFRFGVAGSNARNVKEGKALRLEIARVLTAIRKAQ